MNFLAEIATGGMSLKKTETLEKRASIAALVSSEPPEGEDDRVRDYFFSSGVDEWYYNLKECTFQSMFVPLGAEEASIILRNWAMCEDKRGTPTASIPDELAPLVALIDDLIVSNFNNSKFENKVFIKLSTRSPKDSSTILQRAYNMYQDYLSTTPAEQRATISLNDRLCKFSDFMIKASAVSSGTEAVAIMLDSLRVAEDLKFAYAEGKESKGDKISVVVRGWDPRITPACEFRGFVWDGEMTCIGQYWHHLHFPELKEIKEQIAEELLEFYNSKLKANMPVPCAMLDLAYVGPGEVLLVEVNPLTDGLGSFPGSTGLFDYEEDVLRGKLPFELRLVEREADKHVLLNVMNPEWRAVLNEEV